MPKKALLVSCVLFFAAALAGAQSFKSVPAPVATWYRDMMSMYVQLTKDLGLAKTPAAVAKAFNDASKTVAAKKLGQRYTDLEAQYEEFFSNNDDSSWVPPADWIEIYSDFGNAMAEYGTNMQNIMAYINNPTVMAAMQNFQSSLSDIDSGD